MKTNYYDTSTWSKSYKYYSCWIKAFKECLSVEHKLWLSTAQVLEFGLRERFDMGYTPAEAADDYDFHLYVKPYQPQSGATL
jgi:hypothetical protein